MNGPEHFLVPDHVFDGHMVHHGVAIGVAGERVTRLVDLTTLSTDATRIDLAGATITPGLIDAHLHLTPWMVYGLTAAGVTTVRDLGNNVEVVGPMLQEISDVPLPTILWSGPLLESNRVNWPSIARPHHTSDEIRTTVDWLAGLGVSSIKLYANATPDLVVAATDQARRHGLRVLHHLGASRFADAVAAGVDELQHLAGCLAKDLGETDWAAAAQRVAAVPIDHCPTLVVWDALAHLGNPGLRRDRGFDWVPQQVRKAWAGAHQVHQLAADRVRRILELAERMAAIPHLYAAGRTLLIGSDAPFPGLVPGFSLHDEAGMLVESGMPSLDVMRALTSGNAAAIGARDAGTIEEGSVADLVAFAGDPTSTIAELSEIVGVWRTGVQIDLVQLAHSAARWFESNTNSPVDRLGELFYLPATAPR